MELGTVVRERRSVRGFFRNREVPRPLLQEALELAQRSPSNCNVQPWRVFIASGKRRDDLSAQLSRAADERGEDLKLVDRFEGDYRTLQVECAVCLYGAMGVARDDRVGRRKAVLRNYEFFDAPEVAIICMQASFGVGVALDVGMYVQTLMLALWERGIQSCAQASLRQFPEITRKVLGIPSDLEILCGLSFGYEDPSVPANGTRQQRNPVQHNVTFLSD